MPSYGKQVSSDVWRSARPQPADYATVGSQFASVLSLEGLEEDEKERQELAPAHLLSWPIGLFQIYLTGLHRGQLDQILDIVQLAPKPLLVHCQHGQDRTGLVIAAYRVRFLNWSKDAAMQEAREFGYRYFINFGLNRTWRNW